MKLMFDLRCKFCKEVKVKFNLDIKVKKRKVEEVGEIHNNPRGTDREER